MDRGHRPAHHRRRHLEDRSDHRTPATREPSLESAFITAAVPEAQRIGSGTGLESAARMTSVRRYEGTVFDSSRWDGLELRPGDIIISTPPKCGTTWTQMICALLVLQEPELPQPLDRLSPWIDMVTRARTEVFAELAAQTHRRFIKTHTPLDGIANNPTVTYICVGRDPRDAALSMHRHIDNMDIG